MRVLLHLNSDVCLNAMFYVNFVSLDGWLFHPSLGGILPQKNIPAVRRKDRDANCNIEMFTAVAL